MNENPHKELIDQALDAFWQVVVAKYPQAKTGDLSLGATIALTMAAEDAVGEWIWANVPPKFRR